MESLKFFDPREGSSGFLSNFHRAAFELDGVRWPTVEHAYQAAKFTDAVYAESIRNANTPRAAKTMGQTREHALHADWETRKQQVMLRLVAAKPCPQRTSSTALLFENSGQRRGLSRPYSTTATQPRNLSMTMMRTSRRRQIIGLI